MSKNKTPDAKPKPFTVNLTDTERAKLERIRRKRGLRSLSDVIRELVDEAPMPRAVSA